MLDKTQSLKFATKDIKKEWFSIDELMHFNLVGLPDARRTFVRLTEKENWKKRPRNARGGGFEYHISSLPIEARLELINKQGIAHNSNKQEQSKEYQSLVAKAQTCNTTKKLLKVALVKEAIVNKIETLIHGSKMEAINTYVAYYNNGFEVAELEFGEEKMKYYEYIKSLSFKTTYRWIGSYKDSGIIGLYPQTAERRKGKGLYDTNEQIKAWISKECVEHPHTPYKVSYREFIRVFGNIISSRSFTKWISEYKEQNKEFLMKATSPDEWKNKYRASFGKAYSGAYINEIWEIDSTVSDIQLSDGKRVNIIGVMDVFTRRLCFHVSDTSSAVALSEALLKALIKLGKPNTIKTDNGKDYVSFRVKEGLRALGINQHILPPFSPELKPFIERSFGTFSRDMLSRLERYIGNSVAMRKKIEAKKSFAQRFLGDATESVEIGLTKQEFQNFCDAWAEEEYANREHEGLKGKTPNQIMLANQEQILRYDETEIANILILLGNRNIRIVGKEGIKVDGGIYAHHLLGGFVKEHVITIFDESDWGRIYVFDMENKFICKAFNIEREGFDRTELAVASKRIQKGVMNEARAYQKELTKQVQDSDRVAVMIKGREQERYVAPVLKEPKQVDIEQCIAEVEDKSELRFAKAMELESLIARDLEYSIEEKDLEWLRYYQGDGEYKAKLALKEN
jgi:putative transposase